MRSYGRDAFNKNQFLIFNINNKWLKKLLD